MLKLLPPTWRQPEMASGLPMVGFNVTGTKDVVKPGGQTGKIIRQACRDAALKA